MNSSFSSSNRRNELTAYVGNIPPNIVPGDLDRFFDGLNPANVNLIRDPETNALKGIAFVEFDTEEQLQQACLRSGGVCLDHPLVVEKASSRSSGGNRRGGGFRHGGGGRPQYNQGFRGGYGDNRHSNSAFDDHQTVPENPPFTAYVGNLPPNYRQEDIREMFNGMNIAQIREIKDRATNGRKNYAYVEFLAKSDLVASLSLSGYEMHGNALKVTVAHDRNRQATEPSGFPMGNRRGGGFERGNDGFGRSNQRGGFERGRDGPAAFDRGQRGGGFDGPAPFERGQRGGFDGGSREGFDGRGAFDRGQRDVFEGREAFDRGHRGYNSRNDDYMQNYRAEFDEPTAEEAMARPRIHLEKQSVASNNVPASRPSSVFGAAKPVDTASKINQIAEADKVNFTRSRNSAAKPIG